MELEIDLRPVSLREAERETQGVQVLHTRWGILEVAADQKSRDFPLLLWVADGDSLACEREERRREEDWNSLLGGSGQGLSFQSDSWLAHQLSQVRCTQVPLVFTPTQEGSFPGPWPQSSQQRLEGGRQRRQSRAGCTVRKSPTVLGPMGFYLAFDADVRLRTPSGAQLGCLCLSSAESFPMLLGPSEPPNPCQCTALQSDPEDATTFTLRLHGLCYLLGVGGVPG